MPRGKALWITLAVIGGLVILWMLSRAITPPPVDGPEALLEQPQASESAETGDQTRSPLLEPLPSDLTSDMTVEGYDWTVRVPVNGLFLLPLPAEAETNPNLTVTVTPDDPSLIEESSFDMVSEGVTVASPQGGDEAYSGTLWKARERAGETTVSIVSPSGSQTVRVIVTPANQSLT